MNAKLRFMRACEGLAALLNYHDELVFEPGMLDGWLQCDLYTDEDPGQVLVVTLSDDGEVGLETDCLSDYKASESTLRKYRKALLQLWLASKEPA